MLFKKFKSKMICFFEVLMVTWHREVLVLRKLELEEIIMQYKNTNNSIMNSFNMEGLH